MNAATIFCLSLALIGLVNGQNPDTAANDSTLATGLLGLEVISFVENSHLEKAGAAIGDLLTRYGGIKVESLMHLLALRDNFDRDVVEVTLQRGFEDISLTIPRGMLGANLKEIAADHEIDDDAVIIDDIGGLGWGLGMDNSFLGCVTVLDAKYGAVTSYVDILGLSGYGFRFHFCEGFCPSSPDATCGRDIGGEILSRLGYEYEIHAIPDSIRTSKTRYAAEEARLRKIIKRSIDNDWPVIAIDLIDTPEWGIITGYQQDGGQLFCRTYFDKTRGYEIARKFPWVIYAITGKKAAAKDTLFRKSLAAAREMHRTDDYGAYASGQKGLKLWIKTLADENFFKSLSAPQWSDALHANWWIYYSLAEARALNAAYLSDNAPAFATDRRVIDDLAGIMEKEAALLKAGMAFVPSPWDDKDVSAWTGEKRKQQAKVLTDLLKLEGEVGRLLTAKIK